MNLDFTEEQQMLRKMAGDFLQRKCPKTLVRELEDDPAGYSPALWQEMAELGWLGLMIPEKYGGSEGGLMEVVILLEEMGRACLPSPFLSTVVLCGSTVLAAGGEEQKQDLLAKIAKGEAIMAFALTEPAARYDVEGITVSAIPEGRSHILNGTKLFVQDAHVADYLLCVTKTKSGPDPEEGVTLFAVDASSPGMKVTPLPSIANDRLSEVIFEKVNVPNESMLGRQDHAWPVVDKGLQLATVAKCAEMIGGSEWVVETTVTYVKERVQYDRPIGSFQAIQHYLADMWTEVNMSKRFIYYVAWLLEKGFPCAKEVAMAKARLSDIYLRVARLGVQIHGAIGITRDHDMGLYYRQARQARLLFGDPCFHQQRIAQEMGLIA